MAQSYEKVHQLVDGMKDTLFGISDFVFEHPELGDDEFESSAYLVDLLKNNGFTVEYPYKGIKTAFRADLVMGEGPTVAFLAEYDALPGYGPEKKPAHACGHNWIAATCVGAGIALSKLKDDFKGKVTVFGTPAEETAGRKVDMAEAGAFDDVDAAFQMHLNKVNYMQTSALAMNSCEFEFIGKAAHAAAFPENGINALDALILTFNGISALRQQLTSDVRIHGIITDGGTAANVIPEHCKANFYVRAARKATFLDAFEKVKNCARGAATMTGCELKINMYENQFDDLQENPVLAEVLEKYLVEAGVGPFPKDEPSPGSTDVGNVSYRCPTLYSEIGVAGGKIAVHEEDFLPVANGPEAKENILKVVKGFACAAIELSQNPDLVKEARKVFEESVAVG